MRSALGMVEEAEVAMVVAAATIPKECWLEPALGSLRYRQAPAVGVGWLQPSWAHGLGSELTVSQSQQLSLKPFCSV